MACDTIEEPGNETVNEFCASLWAWSVNVIDRRSCVCEFTFATWRRCSEERATGSAGIAADPDANFHCDSYAYPYEYFDSDEYAHADFHADKYAHAHDDADPTSAHGCPLGDFCATHKYADSDNHSNSGGSGGDDHPIDFRRRGCNGYTYTVICFAVNRIAVDLGGRGNRLCVIAVGARYVRQSSAG
jgi:hypothetical protein